MPGRIVAGAPDRRPTQLGTGYPLPGQRPQGPCQDVTQLGDRLDRVDPGRRRIDEGACRGGEGPEPAGPDLHAQAVGHDLLHLVGLVEDHDLMGREHRTPAGQVGPVQVGVHYHHVGLGGTGAGVLGEAVAARRAPEGARALACRGGHHGPGPVVGLEVELGAVAGGRLVGPPHQPPDLVPQATGLDGIAGVGSGVGSGVGTGVGSGVARLGQRVIGVGRVGPPGLEGQLLAPAADLGHPLPAHVVAAPLQHGEGEPAVEGPGHHGQVLRGQLVLECLGGRGHHHPLAGEGGRHQVGERLPGARARLDHQVPVVGDGAAHRRGHLLLAEPALATPGQGPGHTVEGGGDRIVHPATLPAVGADAGTVAAATAAAGPAEGAAEGPARYRARCRTQCHSTASPTATARPTTTMTQRRTSAGSLRP